MAGEEDGRFMLRFSGVASSNWAGLLRNPIGGESPLLRSKDALPVESPDLLRGLACFRLGPEPCPGLEARCRSGSWLVRDIGLDWFEWGPLFEAAAAARWASLLWGSSWWETEDGRVGPCWAGGYRAGLGLYPARQWYPLTPWGGIGLLWREPAGGGLGGKCWSEEVSPLTLSDSAAFMRPVSWDSGTEVSPLYMKSTMHWTSQPRMSLRTMMGCLQGLSVKIFWK